MEPEIAWLLVAFSALALEALVADFWWPLYFRVGIPIFRRSFPLPSTLSEVPAAWSFDDSPSVWVSPMAFRELSSREIAFRDTEEGFALFQYVAVMHGVLRLVPEQRRWEIVGFANLSTFFVMAVVAWQVPEDKRLVAVLLAGLVGGAVYAIQAYRFSHVSEPMKTYISACAMAAESRAVSPIRQR